METARERVGSLLPDGGKVIFTSGATEALNMVLQGTPGRCHHLRYRTRRRARLRPRRGGAGAAFHHPARDSRWPRRSASARGCNHARHGLVAAMAINNEIGFAIRSPTLPASPILPERACWSMRCRPMAACRWRSRPITSPCRPTRIPRSQGIGALWLAKDAPAPATLMLGGGQEAGLRFRHALARLVRRVRRRRAGRRRAHGRGFAPYRTALAQRARGLCGVGVERQRRNIAGTATSTCGGRGWNVARLDE